SDGQGGRAMEVDPLEVVEDLGLGRVRVSGGRITALCPLHDDRTPSFSMNAETGQWRCHACGEYGNLRTLKRKLGRGEAMVERNEYERVTDQCSGSIWVIEDQLRRAIFLLGARVYPGGPKFEPSAVVKILVDEFSISFSTARRRVKAANSGLPVREIEGVRVNVRTAHCLKVLRERMPEHERAVALERHQLKWRWSWLTHKLREKGYVLPNEKLTVLDSEVGEDEVRRIREAAQMIPHAPPGIGRWTHKERLYAAVVIARHVTRLE